MINHLDLIFINMVSKRRIRGQPKLKKEQCEICNLKEPKALDIHHIIPRCDPKTENNNRNLMVTCGSCHRLIHAGEIIVLGVYLSTNGRIVIWHKKDEEPPLEEKFWRIKNNDKVILR